MLCKIRGGKKREKRFVSKFVNTLIMQAGIATIKSIQDKEPRVVVSIPLELKPSVLTGITETPETVLYDSLKGEEKQKRLTQSLSLFLSDAIDCGIISSSRQTAKGSFDS